MAILDFLVPDLAPEQYSSGQGTGYAQQYNLGAPNPFDVAQQYADKAVQTKKLELEKDLLNEKKRQEAFSKYITDIKYDPKWVIAESNFEQEVDDIGNFISEYRASGKPVNTEFQIELNKKKARLNSLKGMNDEAFTRYNKNMQTMLAGLGKDYEQEDINEYESEVKKAYEQGGVEAGFDKINQLRPLKQFDLIGYLKKDYVVPENETGEILETKPEDLDRMAKFKWDGLTDERKKEVMEDVYLERNTKEATPEATIGYFRQQLDLWDKDQKARAKAARSSGSKKTTDPQFSVNTVADTNLAKSKERNLDQGDINNIPLWTRGQNPVSMSLTDYDGKVHSVVVTDVIPYWTGSERKFSVRAIPMDQIKATNSGITDVSQVTPGIIEKYSEDELTQYPLSEYYNAEAIEQKFPGITKRIKEQIERDRKNNKKVTWEKKGKFY